MSQGRVYPCTIIADRYSGGYSHGLFIAFNLEYSAIPWFVGSNDTDEMNGWHHCDIIFGRGDTPQLAYEDLQSKLGGMTHLGLVNKP